METRRITVDMGERSQRGPEHPDPGERGRDHQRRKDARLSCLSRPRAAPPGRRGNPAAARGLCPAGAHRSGRVTGGLSGAILNAPLSPLRQTLAPCRSRFILPLRARPCVRSRPAPLLLGLAVFALAAFSPAVLNDGDTWSHVATGQWILAHGAIPRVDPFSYTFAGQPWTAHEWLAEVLMALAFRVAGWGGVALLTGAAAGAAIAIAAQRAARDLAGPALLALAALSALLLAPSLLARPHIIRAAAARAVERGAARGARRRPRPRIGAGARDDPLGQSARWLCLRPGADRALRAGSAARRASPRKSRDRSRLEPVRRGERRGGDADAVWRRGPDLPDPPARPCAPRRDRRVATGELRPSRADGAGAAGADRLRTDPPDQSALAARRASRRPHPYEFAARPPSDAARHPRADAACPGDPGWARRRTWSRTCAAPPVATPRLSHEAILAAAALATGADRRAADAADPPYR